LHLNGTQIKQSRWLIESLACIGRSLCACRGLSLEYLRKKTIMPLTLPDLPYSYDALAPYLSQETLKIHHDVHHLAYIESANKLLKGSEWEDKSLQEVVIGAYGKNAMLFNNVAQHYNHFHFWHWMMPKGGVTKSRKSRAGDPGRFCLGEEDEGSLHRCWRKPIRSVVLVGGQGGRIVVTKNVKR